MVDFEYLASDVVKSAISLIIHGVVFILENFNLKMYEVHNMDNCYEKLRVNFCVAGFSERPAIVTRSQGNGVLRKFKFKI